MSSINMSQWLDSPAWMRDAECHLEPGLPWTTDGYRVKKYEVHAMAAVCARCPVLAECRDYANENTDLWGFWAGQTRPGTINKPGRQRARPNDADLILATQDDLDEGPVDISEAETVDDLDDLDDLEEREHRADVNEGDELGDGVSHGASGTPGSWVRDASVTMADSLGGASGWSQTVTAETAADRAPVGVESLVEIAGQLNQAMAVYEQAVRVDGIGAGTTTGARVGFLGAVERLYRYAKAAAIAANAAASAQTADHRGAA